MIHWTDLRLGWQADSAVNELRAEMGAALLAGLVGLPVLADLKLLPNHTRHAPVWVKAMDRDEGLIGRVADAVWAAADFVLSFESAA